jgi:anti-sigma factor RsiW
MNPDDEKLRKILHERFDSVLEEPIPARMHMQSPRWMGHALAAAYVLLGVAIGIAIPYARDALRGPPPAAAQPAPMVAPLAARAARAHLVYAPEVRHPVEVSAAEQEHLVKWLSKRLGNPLKVPVLAQEGYELLGGRLLPGRDGPVAQFMYQDAAKKRLTVYVTGKDHKDPITAFRFVQEGNVSVFYWIDQDCGYAISGEIERPELSRLANVIYKQLEEH